MKKQLARTLFLSFIATLLLNTIPYAAHSLEINVFIQQVSDNIKAQLADDSEHSGLVCQGEIICGLNLMPGFYQERNYTPVWFDTNGMRPAAKTLVQTIKRADQDGLHPADYHTNIIKLLLADYDYWPLTSDDGRQAAIWADLDLLLTDAFLLLGSHLSRGRIDPETLHADWIVSETSFDVMDMLHTVTTEAELEEVFNRLRPDHKSYLGLRYALSRMRQLQAKGGWPVIGGGPTLRPGDQDDRILLLRQRLLISEDLDSEYSFEITDHYDDHLSDAVQHFQQRHGLKPDSIIGSQTLKALNVTADQRVQQIELNLERWRWLPRNLSQRYILVNTADFNLRVVENEQAVLHMRVVVGRPARRTPIFSAPISYMVVNPYWTVPHKLAVEDILPKLSKGIDYLSQQGFKVFNSWNEKAEAIDPNTVNWNIYGKSYFPFRLRQDPGPRNALGRIKFMMPNKFSVYLHDTPQRSLFSKVKRDLSSGCIRVQDAHALAKYLLANDQNGAYEHLNTALSNGRRQVVRLANPIPVHLLYMTAWMDGSGDLQFRNDIYDRDRDLNNALKQRQPAPLPPLIVSEMSTASN